MCSSRISQTHTTECLPALNRAGARFIVCLLMCSAWLAIHTQNRATAKPQPAAAAISFRQDIQPIFRRHCYRCHGKTKAEASVRLSNRDSALGTGDSGVPIITPGDVNSLLLLRITGDEHGDTMPLDSEPLSAGDIDLIRRWIQQGAGWPDDVAQDRHWAYTTPVRPEVPRATTMSWPHTEVDHFVLARLRVAGLNPSPPAEKTRLIRRVSLALTGIPPTLKQIEDFLNDNSDHAYERVVDRLLDSERYGERWAQHWLDLARYADSNGFQADQLRDSWAYRDWVIRAMNRDMPFDQFTIEQLAGDLLPNASADQKIATGFHRTPTCNVEAGVQPEANRVNQVFDRVNTTGTVFLGTTMECCQCHDHKYDPFTQEDYYRLFAYFNNTKLEVEQTSGVTFDFVGPTMDLPLTETQQAKRHQLQSELDRVTQQQRAARRQMMAGFDQWQEDVATAVRRNPARWQTAQIAQVQSNGGEQFLHLEDGSILAGGSVPGTSIYTMRVEGPRNDIVGFKIETLLHDSLPGKGPGRGDDARPNFVLSEFGATVNRSDGRPAESIELHSAQADFSQAKWDVAGAIDGNRKTGWAIAPKFHEPHWATFRTRDPIQLATDDSLTITFDQNLGRGRTIGRVRVSILVGSELTADLPQEIVDLINSEQRSVKQQSRLKSYFANSNPRVGRLSREIKRLRAELNKIKPLTTLVMVELDRPRQTHVLNRGDYLDPAHSVDCGTPQVLHPLDPELPANRLGFARWLVSRENPLLARVTVNRWWYELFGRGIVATLEDLGTQSELPTHPQLLDWLAVELMESNWSMKHIHKKIVMSATFRQSAEVTAEQLQQDPENKWYGRGPRFRLPAESVRDNALAICGMLSTKMYGPPIMPYQPDGIWKSVGRNQPKWVTATGEDRFRRGLYVVWKRAAPYPSFVNFDAPDRAACTVVRPRSNTPLQALTLLNDPAYAEMAMLLAQRMLLENPAATPAERAAYGFRLCVARHPSTGEVRALTNLYHQELVKLKENPQLVKQRLKNMLPSLRDDHVADLELTAWFAVANVLLNLDETLNL